MRPIVWFAVGLDDSGREKVSEFLKESHYIRPISYQEWAEAKGYGKLDLDRNLSVKKEWLKHVVYVASKYPATMIFCDDMNYRKQRRVYIKALQRLGCYIGAVNFLCLMGRNVRSRLGLERFDCVSNYDEPLLSEGFDVCTNRFGLVLSLSALAR
jgi:hypothetical protein